MPVGQKSVSWMELFFDLIIVASSHQLAYMIAHTETFREAVPSLLLFVPVIWAWMSHTLFTNQFADRSWFYHTTTFIQLVAIITMTILMPHVSEYANFYAYAYIAVKLMLVLQYTLYSIIEIRRLPHTLPTIISNAGVGVLFLLSTFAESPYIWWALAIGIDILTPIFTKTQAVAAGMDPNHLPERLGLLTVIVLGEMIISLVISTFGKDLTTDLLSVLAAGILVASFIFWTYFRFIQMVIIGFERSRSRLYFMGHLPLVFGLVCIAAGYKAAMGGGSGDWMLVFGICLFVLSFRMLRYVQDRRFVIRQIVLVALLGIMLSWYYFFAAEVLYNVAILSIGLVIYLVISEFFFGWSQDQTQDRFQKNGKIDWEF